MQNDSEIYAIVKRSNTAIVLYSLIGFIIVAAGTYLFLWPFWEGQLREPTTVQNRVLVTLPDDTKLYNQSVSGLEMFDIGYEEYTYNEDTGKRISTDAYFGLLQIDFDHFLLIRTKNAIDENLTNYTGTLKPIPSNIQREVVDAFVKELEAENITDVIIMPLMIDTIPDNGGWYIGTGVLVIIALLSTWGIVIFLRRGDPLKHPVLKKLSRFGDVEMVVDSIDKDRAMGEEKFGKLYLTCNWAFTKGRTKFNAMSLRDTVWVYQQITQHRTNGVPTGKTYAVHIYDKYGENMIITGKEQQVGELIKVLVTRTPWVIAGYSDEIRNAWNQNRTEFIAEVEKRRTQSR